jgi:hypothetical protein
MASSKAKTTMSKMNRERKVRERRLNKEARKTARSNAPEGEQAEHVDHREYWLDGAEQTDVADPAAKT